MELRFAILGASGCLDSYGLSHIVKMPCCWGVGVTIFEVLVEGRLLLRALRCPDLDKGITVSIALR